MAIYLVGMLAVDKILTCATVPARVTAAWTSQLHILGMQISECYMVDVHTEGMLHWKEAYISNATR